MPNGDADEPKQPESLADTIRGRCEFEQPESSLVGNCSKFEHPESLETSCRKYIYSK